MTQPTPENIKKLLESEAYDDAITLARSVIKPVIASANNNCDEATRAFIDSTLPLISKELFSIEKAVNKVTPIVIDFIYDFITLTVKFDLPVHLLRALIEGVQNYDQKICYIDPIDLSVEEKDDIINKFFDPSFSVLKDEVLNDASKALIANTITTCFSLGLFNKMFDPSQTLSIPQFSLMFRLFYSIESFLNSDIVFTLLPFFVVWSLSNLKDLSDDSEDITEMLANFVAMVPERSNDILRLFCKLISTGPVNRRLMTIKRIHSIVINEQVTDYIAPSLSTVKKALFEGGFENANIQLFNQVLNFLPVLSESIEFTDDDLINMLKKVRSPSDPICKCIARIIPNVEGNLKKFAQYFLDSNAYSLDIICLLTSRINNQAMNQSLFHLMLNPPEEVSESLDNQTINTSFEQNSNMKALIEHKMEETKDPQTISSLGRIIVNAPNLHGIDRFIKKVIKLSLEHQSLVSTLMTFSLVLKSLDENVSRDLVTELFTLTFSHMNDDDTTYRDQILPVFTEWITQAPLIDQELILSKLHKFSFMEIKGEFVPLISSVISKSSKSVQFKELLLKIIFDTVPMKFSDWAVKTFFEHFHSDDEILTLVTILLCHLRSEPVPNDILQLIFSTQQKMSQQQRKPKKRPVRKNRRKKPKYNDYDDYDAESEDESVDEDSDSNIEDAEPVFSTRSLKNIHNSDTEETKETKKRNSIFLMKRCAMYEADFFRIGETYGTNFEVIVSSTKTQTKLNIGLHPYHTCRRIYAEVAKKMHLSVDKFELQLINKAQDTIQTIIASMPISEMVKCSSNKIRLSIKTVDTGISVKEFQVDPIFLNHVYSDNDLQQALYDLLNEEQAYDDITPIEILQLFEPFNKFEATSPLQKVLLRNYDRPLDFEENKKIFPFALTAYSDTAMDVETFTRIIDLTIHQSFDNLTAVIISKAISRIECPDFVFTPEIIKKGLIQNKHKTIRHALMNHFSSSSLSNFDDFISLIPFALQNEFRENSKEFLMCLKKLGLFDDTFVPFYMDLQRYETINNVDQTFISLLQLIPKNSETIRFTFERLSLGPTVRNPQNPFVHSERARKAAFDFLNTDEVYPIITDHMLSLPQCPTPYQKLSDDFTFKGRSGINNLGSTCYINALMQSLNTLPNFVNFILSLPSDDLSLYLRELRTFLAQLRYSRNSTISLRPLIETIDPNFDTFIQHDTEEFLGKLIDRLTDELKDSAQTLREELEFQTQIETIQMDSGEKGSSTTESFLVFPLPTRDLHDMIESMREYFKDQIIENFVTSTSQQVRAVRKTSIMKWPNSLIIQLQRWDFSVEKGEISKLVHEFGFPMKFSTEELGPISETHVQYQLSAIIVHEGGIDSGHYFALVNGDTEWYLCNDANIELFDIANIPSWSFGVKDNETFTDSQISTAYLLFYRRVDIEIQPPTFACDFEEQINKYNLSTWPSSFFYSRQFLNFARDLTTTYPNNEATTQVALTCLFKIAIVNEIASRKWQEHIMTNFLNTEDQCLKFFGFIKDHIGTTLGQLINFSDNAYETLRSVILAAFSQLPHTAEPLAIVLTSIDFALHKRSIGFVCELIVLAYQDLQVNWAKEIDALVLMVKYITLDLRRDDLFNKVKNQLAEANEMIQKILSNVVLQGVFQPIDMYYQPEALERLGPILKSSEAFYTLTKNSEAFRPWLVSTAGNALEPNVSSSDKGILDTINANFVGPILEKLCFSSRQSVRRNICGLLCEIMDQPSGVVENYIKNRVFQPELEWPPQAEESTFLDLLASLISIGLDQSDLKCFNEFLDVLVKLSIAAPFATSLSFSDIINAIPKIERLSQQSTKNDNIYLSMLKRFMVVVKHLVAYDDSLREQVTPEIVKTFLNLDYGCQEALQFVALFNQNSSGSRLFGSCISQSLRSPYSATSKKITEMVQSGMSPGDFVVPNVAEAPPNDLNNIEIATALFECCDSKKDDLKNYILYILQHLKPAETYSLPPFAKAIQLLENYYQMTIEDMMQSLIV